MKDELLKRLECFKDPEFLFDPGLHKYTYHGDTFQSVTQLIGQFHEPFDSEKWSKIKADQAGVDQDEIKKEWKRLNDYANEIGTDTHQWIEDHYNKIWLNRDESKNFHHKHENEIAKVFVKPSVEEEI